MRAVLTYHSIDPSGSPISVHPEAFRRNAEWLASGRVPVVSVAELVAGPAGEHAVAITFDDAFESFRGVAWPLLKEAGVPVTVFVPTGHVGRTNRWPDEMHAGIPELPLLDREALAALAADGVALESHAESHRDLRTLDDEALRAELEGSAAWIEEVAGRRPEVLAYPYGLADGRVARVAGETYSICCTDRFAPVPASADRALVPRLDAYYFQGSGILEGYGSWRFEAYWRARLLGRRVRRSLDRAGLLRD